MLFNSYMNPPEISKEFKHSFEADSLKFVETFALSKGLHWTKFNNFWVLYENEEVIATFTNYSLFKSDEKISFD